MVLGRDFTASLEHDHASAQARTRERERLREVSIETVAPPERVRGRDGLGVWSSRLAAAPWAAPVTRHGASQPGALGPLGRLARLFCVLADAPPTLEPRRVRK